jgi:hypothetical protein
MPYNEAQNKLFRAAEHDPKIAKSSGIPMATAKKLAAEGVKGKKKNKLAEMAKHG